MKTIITGIRNLKLNQKFSLIVFCFALAPMILLSWVLFANTQEMLVKDKTNEIAKNLALIEAGTGKTVELCNMTRQVFLNDEKLRSFLSNAKSNQLLTAEELIEFRTNGVANLEKVINSNPYLYQVRVYYGNEDYPEIMPILYHTSRMNRLSWARSEWVSGSWQLGYEDRIFPEAVMRSVPNIMSLVTNINDYEYGVLGTLEIAVKMDDVLPGLNSYSGSERFLFIQKDGVAWYDQDDPKGFWKKNAQRVLPSLREQSDTITYKSESGETAILSYVYLEQLQGWYVAAIFPQEITALLDGKRIIFLIGTISLLLLLAAVINLITKTMLRQFYKIINAVAEVKEGSLKVRVPEMSGDEGVLGQQINNMLNRIIMLMNENVKKQLLAKNSEIRALQSQINAHFIYNVLESIKMMAEVEHKYEIADSITSLGKLLRYSMQWTSENVTIEQEIAYVKDYLNLINLRLDYHIELQVDLDQEIKAQRIPKLSLQPMVENAVSHGLKEQDEDTVIEITASVSADKLIIYITDYGSGIPADLITTLNANMWGNLELEEYMGHGIGLKNVNDRIVMAFGEHYGVSLVSEQGCYTIVSIQIPYTNPH